MSRGPQQSAGDKGQITRFRWFRKRDIYILFAFAAVIAVACIYMFTMPGKSFSGPLPPLGAAQAELGDALRGDVEHLAVTIGERHIGRYDELQAAAAHIRAEFESAGYAVESQHFDAMGRDVHNLIVEIPGSSHPREIVVVGGHYDSIQSSPGANDNASAVAAVLALARHFAGSQPKRTLRFVAFCNEEPPFFYTDEMGSLVYARRCQGAGDNIVAMVTFDGIGCFSDDEGTQHYPVPIGGLYPTKGNFIGFVSNLGSRSLVRRAIASFREHATIPSEAAALPGFIRGIGFSDHWAFWKCGYKAIMITDTLPFRYPHHHTPQDTPDKLDFDRMARVVDGVVHVVDDLVSH